jgi:hypothetical protein
MKRLVIICLIMTFYLEAQRALCQVKSDFSDWNVPPPVPTGTIPKGPGGAKTTVLLLPADVTAPSLQSIDLKLAGSFPISQTAPDVQAPEQPKFPPLPFNAPDIPLPAVPPAIGLPKQTLHDEITESNTDMPEPVAPEMPAFPKMPVLTQKPADEGVLKLPLIPAIIVQPDPSALPLDAFPFLEWPVPGIPVSSEMNTWPAANSNDDKIKPTNKKKTAKKLKGG